MEQRVRHVRQTVDRDSSLKDKIDELQTQISVLTESMKDTAYAGISVLYLRSECQVSSELCVDF